MPGMPEGKLVPIETVEALMKQAADAGWKLSRRYPNHNRFEMSIDWIKDSPTSIHPQMNLTALP